MANYSCKKFSPTTYRSAKIYFFYVYSGLRDTFFELLTTTMCPEVFLLWYENLPIENALWGLKTGGK